MKKYEVCFSIRGSITIEAKNEDEAREFLLSSDYTGTSELFSALESSIEDSGNDVITVDDIYENNDI